VTERVLREVELVELYETAQEAVRTRDMFFSVAAHELRSPITTIQGYTDLLQRRATSADQGSSEEDKRVERAIGIIQHESRRLGQLIEVLFDLSRIQEGRLELTSSLLDLVALLRQQLDVLAPTLTRHSLEFVADHPQLLVEGDGLRLGQVFQNLLENAVKYSPEGGRVQVRVQQRGAHVCVLVRDEGIGISAEGLERIFTPFFRDENAEQGQFRGMGLGLYVVRELVTRHGGRIEVHSEPGRGSAFEVCLPLSSTSGG
jgi:signal transduction histidine kinase